MLAEAMGKKKTKRQLKREERDRQAEELAIATEAFEGKRRKYRIAAAVLPIVTLVASIAVYIGLNDKQLAGLTGMIGIAIWIPMMLGAVGSQVKPRDRTRAGSIDFGSKR